MTNDENNDHGESPVSDGTRVEDYDRSTGHVRGYWRDSDGHKIDAVESDGHDVSNRPILNKSKNAGSIDLGSLSRDRGEKLAFYSDDPDVLNKPH